MNIVILDDYARVVRTLDSFSKLSGHEVTTLHEHITAPAELAARIPDAEALVLLRERTHIPAALVEKLPKLKMISQNGRDPHIDTAACTKHGVAVCCNVHARPSYGTTEMTWALVLAGARNLTYEAQQLRRGKWQNTVGTLLRGKALCLLGYGKIGKQVAEFGKAFGMRVLVWSRERGLAAAQADELDAAPSQRALFAQADVLSVHWRLTPETRGVVTAADLALMKPGAIFVNTSRAQLVAPGALIEALKAGRPGRRPSTCTKRNLSTATIRCWRWTTWCARRTSDMSRAISWSCTTPTYSIRFWPLPEGRRSMSLIRNPWQRNAQPEAEKAKESVMEAISSVEALNKLVNPNSGKVRWRTPFIGTGTREEAEVRDAPLAFLIKMTPDSILPAHFHPVDQFQVFVSGRGLLGKHAATALSIHYADRHTAYDPITAGAHGVSYFTQRAKNDARGMFLNKPGVRELLKPSKRRFRMTDNIVLSTPPVLAELPQPVTEVPVQRG